MSPSMNETGDRTQANISFNGDNFKIFNAWSNLEDRSKIA